MESDNKPELRMILLGKDSSEISTVGNFILGREAFDTEAPPPLKEQQSERAGGMVEGRYITLINTPHLFDPQLSEQELNQRVRECVALCSPGPHVFLLVLQPENFTMNDCITLRNVLNTYSPLSMKYSLVLTTSKAHGLFGVKGFLSVVIRECGGKHHQFTETIQYNKYQVIQLLEKIDEVVSMNAGNHLICEINESFEEALREGKLLVKPGQTCFAEKDGNRGGRKQSERKTPKQKVCEELRMVLLGKNSSAISRVGNFILDRDAFNTEAPPPSVEKHSVRAAGMVEGRYITLINTPQLFHPQVSLFQITVQIKECMILCSPGPHVLVLVLQPDDFTERDRHRLNYILRTLSEDAYKHTLILIKQKQQSGSCEHPVQRKTIATLFEEHSNRIIKLECSRSDLVDMIKRMVDLNGGRHLEWEEYEEAPPASEQQQHRQMPTQSEIMDKPSPLKLSQRLNLVLCGSNRVMKSSISDLILGQRELRPDSSSVCVRREAEVCGHQITLVELPALYNNYFSEKEVMRDTLRCVIHCDPGIHAFLLILPEGHLADEDKGELEMLQRIFGSTLNSYIIFLINTESLQEGMEIDKETKTFTETYRGGYYTFGHVPDVSGLMERVQELLLENNGDVYTPLVFLNEQIGTQIRRYKDEVSEMKKTIQTLQRKGKQKPDELRIVLLGKSGAGISSSGNTILGEEDIFREGMGAVPVTTLCQKETTEINEKSITVIDTPGFFQTNIPNEEIRKEIAKCITMAAPGPHVFLLVLTVGRFTQEEQEAVKMIQDLFGEESRRYTMVLFTRGDDLGKMSIEDFIKASVHSLQNIIYQCRNRYHVFNNRNPEDRMQVTDLLEKIDSMVAENGGSFYTDTKNVEA
uniref:GTPase IMAP family member 8 n=1 Tax=Astyanax mexicanus TaxID=7994 RepID=A0A3B1KEI5_ASTMX